MQIVEVNLVAVVVAAAVAMVLGFLWYGPLFGKQWMGHMGWTKEKMESMKKNSNMNVSYGLMAASALVMAYVLAHVLEFAETQTVVEALQGAFWVWLGFVATVLLGKVLWEGKSWNLYLLDVGYYLVSLGLMSVVLMMMS